MNTEVRVYTNAAVEIVQSFPKGVPSITSLPTQSTCTGWPVFEGVGDDLDWFTYNGFFAGDVDQGRGLTCKAGIQGGAPLVFFHEKNTVVLSPLERFKTAHLHCGRNGFFGQEQLTLGLKKSLTGIPKGFQASWLLHGGTGITSTMMSWGDILLKRSGKKRTDLYAGEVVGGLGYWTDNGAYFHYPTSGGTTRAGGYEEEILEADAVFKGEREDLLGQHKIPFRHWQLDSWWYEKGKGGKGSSRGRGRN